MFLLNSLRRRYSSANLGKKQSKKRKRNRVRPMVEGLEERVVPSTIRWVNEFDSGNGFQATFGAQESQARAVVNAAIDAWEKIVVDFNYAGDEDDNTYDLSIQTANLGVIANANSTAWDAIGRPTAGFVNIDTGTNHFIDSTPRHHEEFTSFVDRFAANGPAVTGVDLYTTVLHEIGHALGIGSNSSLRISSFLTDTGVDDPNANDGDLTTDEPNLFTVNVGGGPIEATLTAVGGAHLFEGPTTAATGAIPVHPNDLMGPGRALPGNTRFLISDTDADLLRRVYGYTVQTPSQIDTFHVTFDPGTDALMVTGTAEANTINITFDGSDILVEVDDSLERIPGIDAITLDSIMITAGDGNDLITIEDIPTFIAATINGGSGDDTITINNISSFAPTTINGGDGDDVISLRAIGAFSPVEINGDGNDDTFQFIGDVDSDIRSDVNFRGGFGNNTLRIVDIDADEGSDRYTLTASTISKPGLFDTFHFSSISELSLNASNFDDVIDIESTNFNLTVHGNGGADTINIGGGDFDNKIFGTVFVSGGLGTLSESDVDTLNIDDQSDSEDDDYTFTDRTLTKSNALSNVLTFVNMDKVVLDANGDDNEIHVNSLNASTQLTVNANGGLDKFYVGDGNYLQNILGPITLNGGSDADELTIDDTAAEAGIRFVPGPITPLPFTIQDSYTLTSNTFEKTTTTGFFEPTNPVSSPTLRFNSISDVTLNASGSTGEDFAEAFSSIIQIESVSTGTKLNVNARAGSDQIIISNEARDLDTIRGRVDVNGGSGRDSLIVRDQDGISSLFGLPTTFSGGLISRPLILDPLVPFGKFAGVEFSNVQAEFRASNTADILLVESTSAATQLEIFAGGGDDLVVFSNLAGNLDEIRGPVTVHGGGLGRLAFNDRNGVGVSAPPYTITSTQVTRPVIPDPFPFSKFAGVTYSGMHSLTFSASELPDIILVESTAPTTPLEIRGNGGADVIALASTSKRLDDIQGRVTVQGGDSFDQVILSDQNGIPSAALPFTFRDGLVTRPILPPEVGFGQFAGLAYDGEVEKVEFRASEGPDILIIESAGATTALDLLGNGGVDQFFVQSPPSSLITIDGGPPTTGPGDRLTLHGTGEDTDGVYINDPSDPTGGRISINGQDVIHFAGLEPVTVAHFGTFTFVSGGSRDDITVDSPEAERSRVDGTSDGVSFENLTFSDVPEVILALAQNDGANPDDRVLIQPGGLAALGLQKLTILVGGGEADVTVLDSTVPVTVVSDEGTTYNLVVTNTLDSGPGSLRAAIEAANALTEEGKAIITFAIPGTDPNFTDADSHLPSGDPDPDVFVISPLTALPALTRGNIVINGQSQLNLTGDTNPFGPEIVLAGLLAGANANGLYLTSSDNLVHGLNIQGFSGDGVLIDASGNTLTGNYIGTNATGTEAAGNGGDGVHIVNSSGNQIGVSGKRVSNVISGNGGSGVSIIGGPIREFDSKESFLLATGAVDATREIPNLGTIPEAVIGQLTFSPAPGSILHVGPLGTGLDDWYEPRPGNEIALTGLENLNVDLSVPGHSFGFEFVEPAATMPPHGGTPVESEFIATLLFGGQVVDTFTFSRENDIETFVGFWSPYEFDRVEIREVVGSNDDEYFGRFYVGTQSPGNAVQRNFIGTTADGMSRLGNGGVGHAGIKIQDSPDNVIGGNLTGAGNIIGGSVANLEIRGAVSANNHILGNSIGVNASGNVALDPKKSERAILVADGAHSTTIGSVKGGGNLIAGHFGNAIEIIGGGQNLIVSNRLGTNASGEQKIGNLRGIRLVNSPDNQIVGNLISGNSTGIGVEGTGSTGLVVRSNFIGTNFKGTEALPNTLYGINIISASGALIGGPTEADRNLISGNGVGGIRMEGGGDHQVLGNYIGPDRSGTFAIAHTAVGIDLVNTTNVTIGAATPDAGNLISGNGWGIEIRGTADGVRIQGNRIGTDAGGTAVLANGTGILLEGAGSVLVGGSGKGDGNVISGNTGNGISIAGGSGHVVAGNHIGTNLLGSFLGNGADGITLNATSDVQVINNAIGANAAAGVALVDSSGIQVLGNAIGSTRLVKPFLPNFIGVSIQGGGMNVVDGNAISGNIVAGVQLAETSHNTLSNNLVGVLWDGSTAIGNDVGVTLAGASMNLLDGNTISGNQSTGILLALSSTTGNRFFRNKIGTSADGSLAIGNGGFGVQISKSAQGNSIGTDGDGIDDSNEGNTIAHNVLAGVVVVSDASVFNTIRGNSIHSNGGLGIDLGLDGVTVNDYGVPKGKSPVLPDIDLGPNNLQNYPDIQQVTATSKDIKILGQLHSSPNTQFIIDFYASTAADPSGNGEGQRWLGSQTITTGEEGVGAIVFELSPKSAAVGEYITTTATNTVTGDTSEFSSAVLIIPRGGEKKLLASEPSSDPAPSEVLSHSQVQSLLTEAAARWNLPAFPLDIRIADLPGLTLGMANGNTIWLNSNAAGWGWFVDPTPWEDSEFYLPGNQGEQGRMDLLRVLMHELGHVLGYEHEEHGVMQEMLSAGERWMAEHEEPTAIDHADHWNRQLDALFAMLATEKNQPR